MKVIRVGAGSLASWRLGWWWAGGGWMRGSRPLRRAAGGGHLGAGDGSHLGWDKFS